MHMFVQNIGQIRASKRNAWVNAQWGVLMTCNRVLS